MTSKLQKSFEENMSKFAKDCLCDNCCYWRTKANTILSCSFEIDDRVSVDGVENPDKRTAHYNGDRSI